VQADEWLALLAVGAYLGLSGLGVYPLASACVRRLPLPARLSPPRALELRGLLSGGLMVALVIGLTGLTLVGASECPPMLALPPLMGVAAGWCRCYRAFIEPSFRREMKSIDVGAGIMLVEETGGPLPEDLRSELELWQQAGLKTLARLPEGEAPL